MQVELSGANPLRHPTPLLAVPMAQGVEGTAELLDEALGGRIAAARNRGDFVGKEGQVLWLDPVGAALEAERILLVGTGDKQTAEAFRRVGGTVAKEAVRRGVAAAAVLLPGETTAAQTRALAEGLVLGSYAFRELKSPAADEARTDLTGVSLLAEARSGDADLREAARFGAAVARAENMARRLGNLPGNIATPAYLADVAERTAAETGMRFRALGPDELRKEGMGALLAVSQGSAQEPRLIILEHRRGHEGDRPLVLLGKGLTFDAGGISIKPAAGMEEMKFDMCGGAAVIAAMRAIAELELQVNVVGVVPSAENLLGGAAMKPGDIIRSHLGKTIEVVNTDAEGRLILADALSYLRRFEPAAVVDAATLTGACVVALGHQASAVMGNDDELLEELRQAGDRTGERCWPLPMHDEYREQIRSDYADLKNSAGRPAGSITAGWFLREFVGDFPWAHLDIAGTAYGDGKLSYQSKGATGVPTRLFVEWVASRAG